MTPPDGERIARVEQQVVDLSAKVDDKFKEVGILMANLTNEVRSVGVMVQDKKTDHERMFSQIMTLEEEIKEIKSQSGLWKWLSPTLAAVFGSIATFLIIEYFKTH